MSTKPKRDRRRTRNAWLPPPVRQVDPDATPDQVARALLRPKRSPRASAL